MTEHPIYFDLTLSFKLTNYHLKENPPESCFGRKDHFGTLVSLTLFIRLPSCNFLRLFWSIISFITKEAFRNWQDKWKIQDLRENKQVILWASGDIPCFVLTHDRRVAITLQLPWTYSQRSWSSLHHLSWLSLSCDKTDWLRKCCAAPEELSEYKKIYILNGCYSY